MSGKRHSHAQSIRRIDGNLVQFYAETPAGDVHDIFVVNADTVAEDLASTPEGCRILGIFAATAGRVLTEGSR